MSFKIRELSNQFVITATLDPHKNWVVQKRTGAVTEQDGELTVKGEKEYRCHGIVGIQEFRKAKYLVIVTKQGFVDTVVGTKIYCVEEIDVLPLSGKVEAVDRKFVAMTKSLLHKENMFYYGKGGLYDLSTTYQSQCASGFRFSPCEEYVWNWHHLPEAFRQVNSGVFLHLVQGSIEKFYEDNEKLHFFLLSRRNRKMAGTRYHRRGVDLQGDCANYVETEMMLFVDKKEQSSEKGLSYLVVRGSIPVMWTQKVNMKYNPPIDTSRSLEPESVEAGRIHLLAMLGKYKSDVLCVDLTKNSGSEKPLKATFKKLVNDMKHKQLVYQSFDLHKVCGINKFHRLVELRDQVQPFFKNGQLYSVNLPDQTKVQDRVLRVNCKDSLDRTNMVQTYFAKLALESMLKDLGYFSEDDRLKAHPKLHRKMIECWSDNGDKVSRLYSGSGALRTSVTRTLEQKQTIFGLIQDGKKSVFRYYQNNLADGYKQDCIDLFAKNYESELVLEKEESPIVATALKGVFKTFKPSTTPEKQTWFVGMFMSLVWLFWFMFVWKIFFQKGTKLVDRPKLVPDEYNKSKKKDDKKKS